MNRMLLLLLLAVSSQWSCTKTYTYQSYEVIRTFEKVAPGEDVKLTKKDGELLHGTVVQVDGDVLTVATFDRGRRKVKWSEVHVAERVKKAVVVVP
jgi:hypothetical protein